jgi:CrcB protein
MNLTYIIAVASGGAVGAVLRFVISTTINERLVNFPYGTLFVNLLGSFIMGLLMAYFQVHIQLSPALKFFLLTGILGALTTYSTFAIESFILLQAGEYTQAFASMALNLLGSIFLAGLGYLLIIQLSK